MRKLALIFTFVAALAALPAQVQSASGSSENEPLWEVHLNMQKIFATPFGQKGVELFEKEKPEEFKKFLKLVEAIGLDPRTDVGEIALFGDGFEEADATIVANLGQSTGNLEGWILAAPGYRSEDLDENTMLHSMFIEDEKLRAWFALPKDSKSSNYTLVGSLDQSRTVNLAQDILAGSKLPTTTPLEEEQILSLVVNDVSKVPMEIDENDPGSAVISTVESFAFNIGSNSENLSLALNISASSSAKARQISQLITGFKAMIQLAPIEEKEAQQVAKVIDKMVVQHEEGQSEVAARLPIAYDLLEELIESIPDPDTK